MYRIEYKGYTVIFPNEAVASRFDGASTAVALGNFDGVHIAHKALIDRAIQMKKDSGSDMAGAWSFSENPLKYFIKNPPMAIHSPEKKAEILLSLGLDFVVLADFGVFKDVPHESFCQYLKEDIGVMSVVCGYNFRFGKGGGGTPAYLTEFFGEDSAFVIGEVDFDGQPVSSTRIRSLIENGDIKTANILLGRYFALTSEVVGGKRLGRSIGFPTANQSFESGALIPKNGIYATRCNIDGVSYIGVTNVGVRPTVENTKTVNAETYILDFSGDIYGKKIDVEFIEYLRDETKFSSIDELKAAISKDAEAARKIVKL